MIAVHQRPTATRGQAGEGSRWSPAVVETGLIVAGLLAMLVFLPHHVFSDAEVRYQALSDLLQHGRLDSSKYSLIGPLFSTPIWFVGGWLHLPHRGVGFYNWCVFALGVGALYWLLKDHVDRRLLRTFLLILIAGSMFPFHLTNYYGEVFTAMCVAAGSAAVAVGRPRLGWPAIVLGIANTPATVPALVLFTALYILYTRRFANALAVVAAVALVGAENWLRRGTFFAAGYESGFGPPFFGLLSILFAPGKGLIFFTPGLFLPAREALARRVPQAKALLAPVRAQWIAFTVGLVAVYAGWWAWDGGWFWGPRFFLFASLPASLVLALRLRNPSTSFIASAVTLGVLALSFWVGLDGALFGHYPLYGACIANNFAGYYQCNYLPQYSVLWYPLTQPHPWSLFSDGWLSLGFAVYALAVFVYLAAPLAVSAGTAFVVAVRASASHLLTRPPLPPSGIDMSANAETLGELASIPSGEHAHSGHVPTP
jgi:hypothetical protein